MLGIAFDAEITAWWISGLIHVQLLTQSTCSYSRFARKSYVQLLTQTYSKNPLGNL